MIGRIAGWLVILLIITAIFANAIAGSNNLQGTPLYGTRLYFENVKVSLLSMFGMGADYKKETDEKHKLLANATSYQVKTGESRPIRGASRKLCDANIQKVSAAPKEYTMSENQQITLDTGEKVTLVIAYQRINTDSKEAVIRVESGNVSIEGDLKQGTPLKVYTVMATLKDVPRFGTAVISFSTVPKRTQPVIFGYLMRFGSYMDNASLRETADAFEAAFENATGGRMNLCITVGGSVDLPPEDTKHRYEEARSKYPLAGDESLKRLWYADKLTILSDEIETASLRLGFTDSYDVLLVLSEAQLSGEGGSGGIEAYGFNTGFSSIQGSWGNGGKSNLIGIHQPVESGYLSGSGYRTEMRTPYQLADTFLHEMGHYMGLEHNSGCSSPDDVMNVCDNRHKPKAEDTFYRVYSKCGMEWIWNQYLPKFLNYELNTYQKPPCP